jgi:hypothetical protein
MACENANLLGFGLSTCDLTVGQLVAISEDDEPLVEFAGNESGPIPARFLEAVDLSQSRLGIAVLLLFEQGNPLRPIIVGNVLNTLATRKEETGRTALLDDQRLLIEAKNEIELKCGNSSILLKKDGKLILRGAEITSRASGVNRIRGAAVKIN